MVRLNKKEQEKLLDFARNKIAWKLGLLPDEPEIKGFDEHCGAFVTLHKKGNLRGCIGNIVSHRSLSETIGHMAIAAATEDPRFMTLAKAELDSITIEISILSPLKPLVERDSIKTGRDGLYVRKGYRSGLLLPQVATEQGWNSETFLNQTFLKAGLLPEDANAPETEIFCFTAEIFSETDR